MALRPVSPVQLVTRALRIVGSAYHASAWHADRYTRATFGTYPAAAFATGTDYAGCAGTSVPDRKVRRQPEHAVGSSKDGTPSEKPDHLSASCRIDDRLSARPARWNLVTLLRILRHVLRSCRYRSTIIDYVSKLPYVLSDIFDTLSILTDAKTFCESISPEKELLQHADYRRLCVWQ